MAGSYVIVKLKERKEADLAEFEKKKGELMHEAALVRGEEVLAEWTQRRCQEAKEAKRIRVNNEILRYDEARRTSGRVRAVRAAVPLLTGLKVGGRGRGRWCSRRRSGSP